MSPSAEWPFRSPQTLLRRPYRRANEARPRLITFLRHRLQEELLRADSRCDRGAGVALVRDVERDLGAGLLPPPWITQTLLVAYADHPDFEPRWGDIPRAGG